MALGAHHFAKDAQKKDATIRWRPGEKEKQATATKLSVSSSCWPQNTNPLVNCYSLLLKITMLNGKIHYFYGHFQLQTVSLPEGTDHTATGQNLAGWKVFSSYRWVSFSDFPSEKFRQKVRGESYWPSLTSTAIPRNLAKTCQDTSGHVMVGFMGCYPLVILMDV